VTLGLAQVLESHHGGMAEEEVARYLRKIARNARKMSNIIDELLLLASVRSAELPSGPLQMESIVEEAWARLADLAAQYQATISMPRSWPRALGYGPWVEEIWVNYLSNAIKYGGRPPRIEVGGDGGHACQRPHMVRFWVRDNGDGLTPEEQAQLFVPFTQLAQVRAGGHGLGLSIVRRIAHKLGGDAGVESNGVPGQGSTFYVCLPRAEA
ncbi:MAG: HAMP domain-containing sensor histidine kinase, partial [Anaerolineae bacterium]